MNILIVDDEQRACTSLKRALSIDNSIEAIDTISDAFAGEKKIQSNRYDIVLLDIIMPGKNGDQILEECLSKGVDSAFIILSGSNDIPTVVKCLKNGAFDYIVKPLQTDIVLASIKKAFESRQLQKSIAVFTSSSKLEIPTTFSEFHTSSHQMVKLMNYAAHLAKTDCNVLITGETGTGKELFANAIHKGSMRNDHRLVPVNVNAIPVDLFESEFFGHKKGAFTGAINDHQGYLDRANNGTLFLDEIGDLKLEHQAKLLRVIENKQFYPVGSTEIVETNFRLISATNKDLLAAVKAGEFRDDLYYRIKVGHIALPPIRDRSGDIKLLANKIIKEVSQKNQTLKELTPDAIFRLQKNLLPGNYRELKSIIESAFYKIEGDKITGCDLVIDSSEGPAEIYTERAMTLEGVKQSHIEFVVGQSRSRQEAADTLGISTRQLFKYLNKYGMK